MSEKKTKEQAKPKAPTFEQQLTQLTQLKVEEQAILKRNLQTFLGSLDNINGIATKTIEILKAELKKND